jgi:hypothetical protein
MTMTEVEKSSRSILERTFYTKLGPTPAFPPKLAAQRWDDYTCAEIARLRKTSPNVDVLFFTWARGFVGGWNAATEKPILKVDPTAMPQDEQLKFIRSYCDGNPSKLYFAAVMELLAKLKYEKTKATGTAEEE